ncbi:hypothetical protein C8R44DRAFT_308576 [Mycena epipterygia]|nr:hypothetical protein C8R44DRAFT_308576 [Mycena epipterygia]
MAAFLFSSLHLMDPCLQLAQIWIQTNDKFTPVIADRHIGESEFLSASQPPTIYSRQPPANRHHLLPFRYHHHLLSICFLPPPLAFELLSAVTTCYRMSFCSDTILLSKTRDLVDP